VSKRRFKIALAVVLGVALLARVAVAEHYSIRPVTDAKDYDRHAVSLADGRGYPGANRYTGGSGASAWRPPLYPYFLAGVYSITGTTSDAPKRWEWGRLTQAFLGVATVALIALIALRLWGRVESIVSGGLAAVYPPLLTAGSALLTEPLFLTLMLGGILAILQYRQVDRRWRWLVLAGVCAGLCSLCRTNGVLVIAALAAGAWIVRPLLSRRGLVGPAVGVVTGLAVVAPWTIRNAAELHSFVPLTTQNGFALAGQYNPVAASDHATWLSAFDVPDYRHYFFRKIQRRHEPRYESTGIGEVALEGKLADAAFDYAAAHPEHVAASAFWNGLRFFDLYRPVATERSAARFASEPEGLAQLGIYTFWLVGALAIAGCFTAGARRVPLFIWLIPALTFVSVVLVYGDSRYRVPAEPVFVMLASLALVTAWRQWRGSSGRTEPRSAAADIAPT
jgi:4-amino-4-deoxy-L-arabinose transferase-like glycosyltransferase